ncbi:MAG: hypothetical protein JNM96_02930 [Bacteroidia bacterium]|nr:hypothetical protein [Bacteroidia bacterium]
MKNLVKDLSPEMKEKALKTLEKKLEKLSPEQKIKEIDELSKKVDGLSAEKKLEAINEMPVGPYDRYEQQKNNFPLDLFSENKASQKRKKSQELGPEPEAATNDELEKNENTSGKKNKNQLLAEKLQEVLDNYHKESYLKELPKAELSSGSSPDVYWLNLIQNSIKRLNDSQQDITNDVLKALKSENERLGQILGRIPNVRDRRFERFMPIPDKKTGKYIEPYVVTRLKQGFKEVEELSKPCGEILSAIAQQ